jgi:hypothetical protein
VSTSGNERLVFIHVPKTGGGWVSEAMAAAGIRQERLGFAHHIGKDEIELKGRFAFAFVREPLSWYGSAWTFRRRLWREKESDPQMEIPGAEFPDEWFALDFPDFVATVIESRPGYLSAYYDHYVGTADDPIDFIGHYENLADDLVKALRLAGQEFDEEALRGFPAVNTSGPPPPCPREVKERLLLAERAAYERFYVAARSALRADRTPMSSS